MIRSQLSKVKVASLDDYDESTKTYHIPKYVRWAPEIGGIYVVEIDDSALSNDVVANNWNNGSKPPSGTMRIEIEKKMGHMLKISGLAIDKPLMWEGWLPEECIRFVSK